MRQRHSALDVVDHNGLCVGAVVGACGAVAHMPHGDVPAAQLLQGLGLEHVVDQADVAIIAEHAVVVDHDAAGLLPAVLEGEQTVIHRACHIALFRRIYAENAAFLS